MCGNKCAGGYTDQNQYQYQNQYGDTNQYGDAHIYPHPNEYSHPDEHAHEYPHANSDTNPYEHAITDTDHLNRGQFHTNCYGGFTHLRTNHDGRCVLLGRELQRQSRQRHDK